MRNLSGRIAVITGAGSGIGAAMAHRFARAGMKIVVADIDPDAAAGTRDALAAAGFKAIAVPTDVTDPAQVEALADQAWAHFGAVDLLCNNAGVVPAGRHRVVWEYPLEDWKWSLDVNFFGVVHGIRSFIPRMLAQNTEGHVITTASVAGLVSGAGSVAYSVAKHAAVRATEALYAALAELLAEDGSGLPPAYVVTAGFDPLRDEGEAYARALREAGVPVTLRRHEGLVHGFVNMLSLAPVARAAMHETATALRLGLRAH
jgi:NAD(P)-dependent dehydrogenase (short-subunit alcohol dehydrogenase family)